MRIHDRQCSVNRVDSLDGLMFQSGSPQNLHHAVGEIHEPCPECRLLCSLCKREVVEFWIRRELDDPTGFVGLFCNQVCASMWPFWIRENNRIFEKRAAVAAA